MSRGRISRCGMLCYRRDAVKKLVSARFFSVGNAMQGCMRQCLCRESGKKFKQNLKNVLLPKRNHGLTRPENFNNMSGSSPHAWGCFYLPYSIRRTRIVFPTRVGVFLCLYNGSLQVRSLPHTRGGVSAVLELPQFIARSSPHAWGCFLRMIVY